MTRADIPSRELSPLAIQRFFVRTASRLTARFSVLDAVHRAYWQWRLTATPEQQTITVGGTTARFGVSTRSERRRVQHLGGERYVLEELLDGLTGTETFWDIGACVGSYSCLVAQRLPAGRVIAFEPEPRNLARLRANMEANAPGADWIAIPIALSDENGRQQLVSEFVEAGGGHHYLSTVEMGRQVEVRQGERVVVDGVPTPDVLKIDVQGAELNVLRGMGRILETVDRIYAELHTEKSNRYGSTTDDVEAFLDSAGFSVKRLGEPTNGRRGVYFVRATRR